MKNHKPTYLDEKGNVVAPPTAEELNPPTGAGDAKQN